MGQRFQFLYESQWITEGSTWRPPEVITLRDEAGVAISSSQIATLLLTLYDLSGGANAIVNSVEQTNIKNARSCLISSAGILTLTLLPADTAILVATRPYELRRVLVEYTWPSTPTKSDCLEVTVVIRNVARRPYAP